MHKFLIDNLSLVIPTKDDHLRIYENIELLNKYLINNIGEFEIIIVSNGSSKESIVQLNTLCSKNQNLKHVVLNKSGKGLAIKEGIAKSKFDNLLFSDADCSVSIDEFNKFVNNYKLKSGFVVGNRKNSDSLNLNSPYLRKVSGYLYSRLIKLIFKLDIEDTQCGFKAIDKSVFKDCQNFITEGYSFDLELFLLANKENINITQIPVKYVHNTNSKISIFKDTIKMLKELFVIYRFLKYD